MSYRDNYPYSNIIPIQKSEYFGVYRGDVSSSDEIIEGESVGVAFLKTGSKKFRLKLFVFPSHQYFVVPDERNDSKYLVLSLEEYRNQSGEVRTSWNCIGDGYLVGGFISLRIQLLPESIYLCLFPSASKPQEDTIAS